MTQIRGEEHNHMYIAGNSARNARIECLWKDLKIYVVPTFREIFWTLEDTGVLKIARVHLKLHGFT